MWKEKLDEILAASPSASHRVDGKVASERTQTLTKEVVCASIRRLHELGFKIQDPKNLGERHVAALIKDWWFIKKKKIKTIQNDLSRLRVFCRKIGKPGMIKSIEHYLPDVAKELLIVRQSATSSKSWSANGIDMSTKIHEVDDYDGRLGLMLRMELAFGLRREEVIKCDPHSQDFGHFFQVFPGQGKGGRWRNIPISTQEQRDLLAHVQTQTKKGSPMGWEFAFNGKTATLAQNIRRYENSMAALGFTKAQLGVTGHGLRAQFAENQCLLQGLLPPSLGGTRAQTPKSDLIVAKTKLTQALGHNNIQTVNAYVGSFSRAPVHDFSIEQNAILQGAIDSMRIEQSVQLPVDRLRDCFKFEDYFLENSIVGNYRHAHELWRIHSNRYGVEWIKPDATFSRSLLDTAKILIIQGKSPANGDENE